MTTEKRRELERALPESYKKGGAGLGDLIGWFVAGREGTSSL